MSGPKIFTPEYYQRMRDLESHGWWNAAMRDVAGDALARAALPAHGLMLDVGCGSGQTMAWFRDRYPGWRTVGLDVAFDGLRAARAGFGERVLGASALELPLADATVDAVVTLDVLQHLPLDGGDRRALAEMRRVLRPGGVLFIRTNAQTTPETPDDPAHLFRRYRGRDLRAAIESAGLQVLRLGRVNALLGLAEIPRDLRAQRAAEGSYTGLLAASRPGPLDRMKRAWLRREGRWMLAGGPLPLGRTYLAVCRR